MLHRRLALYALVTVTAMVVWVLVIGVPWTIVVFVAVCLLGAGIVIGGTAAYVSDQVRIRRHKDEVSMDALMDRVDQAANRYNTDNHQHEDES
jgi:membrane protein YdbS with pleckstrin-like domain